MNRTDQPREQALQILCGVEEGAFADALLERARAGLGSRDRAFVLELVYGVLRNRTRLDWMLDRFSAQPVARTDIRTRNVLRLGAYQMFFLERVPVSAAVNTATELAKKYGRKNGYVNGLLRSMDRGKDELERSWPADPRDRLPVFYSHPAWLVRRWLARFGPAKTEDLLRGNNRPAPLVIRTNTLTADRNQLRISLEAEGARAAETVYSPQGLEILSSPGLQSLTAYEKGWFVVQDEAAQLIAFLLGPRPGEIVLDACAAPGGKATHLAELMENRGNLIALDNEPSRLDKIRENTSRLGISCIEPVLGDAAAYRNGPFDRILIDAPCSGLGVLRRHPDGRWNKQERSIPERAAVQRQILHNCASLLKPGGVLVYATCTTEPEENEDVIEDFLSRAAGEFVKEDPRPHLPEPARRLVDEHDFFRTFPLEPVLDGFFGVRLVKKQP